jgi:hypothetical protein
MSSKIWTIILFKDGHTTSEVVLSDNNFKIAYNSLLKKYIPYHIVALIAGQHSDIHTYSISNVVYDDIFISTSNQPTRGSD